MMINCPNCKLLQPKDQYCAQCGVNMDTWKPPEAPLWKKLIGNWMVQLGVLFLLILCVVMWDSVSSRTPKSSSTLPPVAKTIERGNSDFENPKAPEPAQEVENTKPADSMNKNRTAPMVQSDLRKDKKQDAEFFEKKLKLSMTTIRLEVIEGLLQNTMAMDENIFLLGASKKFLSTSRKNVRTYGSTAEKTFEYGQAVELFFGEQDQVSGKNIGFFLQVNITEGSTPDTMGVELRYWQQLSPTTETNDSISSYFSIPRKSQYLFIVSPYVGSREFSPDDIGLFEGSSRLKGLASEAFLDGASEFAYLLQIK